MSSNEIGTNVIFKKQLGLNFEIDQKYVNLQPNFNHQFIIFCLLILECLVL